MNIQEELKGCRKAWKENPDAKYAWCCHHAILIEPLLKPYKNRIAYILSGKPEKEKAIRLHNFRPVRVKLMKTYSEAGKAYDEAGKSSDEARRAYDEAGKSCDEAGKAYYEAGKAYDEARRACDEAGKAYDEAGKSYDEARRACDEAGKAYEPELVSLFKQDWPDNTWNGKDIFNEKTTTRAYAN